MASLARLLNHAQDRVAADEAHNERQELHVRRRKEANEVEPRACRVELGKEEGVRLQREQRRRDDERVPDDEAPVCVLALCMQLPRVCVTSRTRHGG